MKSGIAIAAVAGLATVASAQGTKGFVELTANGSSGTVAVAVGDVVTIGVSVDDISPTGVLSFDIQVTSADAGFTVLGAPTFNAAIFGPGGAALANGATGLGGSTDILGPTFDAPLNALAYVYTFQIMITAAFDGEIVFVSSDGSGPNAAMQYAIGGGIVLLPGQYDQINHSTLRLTPAPSGMALMGLGGLIAARRRRS
ncbi:MAG: hypothetical protein R3B57_08905 [Phycisphaerales bacterium]